jgi:hypothetical protein
VLLPFGVLLNGVGEKQLLRALLSDTANREKCREMEKAFTVLMENTQKREIITWMSIQNKAMHFSFASAENGCKFSPQKPSASSTRTCKISEHFPGLRKRRFTTGRMSRCSFQALFNKKAEECAINPHINS